jgi:hypothetical protein
LTEGVQFLASLYYAKPEVQHEFDDSVLKGILKGIRNCILLTNVETLEDTEIDMIVREMKIKGCSEEIAQIRERFKKLHPRYKAKIGQIFLPESEPTQTKVIRSKTRPASASEALHVCKNVPTWGLHSIEGEDMTPPIPKTKKPLLQARQLTQQKIGLTKGKIKNATTEGRDTSELQSTLTELQAEFSKIEAELKKFK